MPREGRERVTEGTWLTFSEVHEGDQPYPHTDGNRHVDGQLDKAYGKESGHHQEQSPGYGHEPVEISVKTADYDDGWSPREQREELRRQMRRR